MGISVSDFGKYGDGRQIHLYTLKNGNGTVLKVSDIGAELVALETKDKDGKYADVVLGYDHGEDYALHNTNAFGATVGRSANRIAGAKFTINGKEYHLAKNDGENNLHCGPNVYNNRMWDAEPFTDEEGDGVTFTLESPDGDQGMPGNLHVSVTYILTADDSVIIEYEGVADADTIVNMTNHSYFNLHGHNSGDVHKQMVWINADYFTHGNDKCVTTGELVPVKGTPMDFNTEKEIGRDINAEYEPLRRCGGYDHNYVLKTNGEDIDLVASLRDKESGRFMEVYTDLPGLQIYTGNFIDGSVPGKGGDIYKGRDAVCFETQFFPDAINNPQFPSPVVKAGEEFNYTTVYKFMTE